MVRIWVAVLNISYATAQKLIHEHQLDPEDVRVAVTGVRSLPVKRHTHPERGERYLVRTMVSGERCQIVLYRADANDPDVWNLGSAYPLDR